MIRNVELCGSRARLTKEFPITSVEIEKRIATLPYNGERGERNNFVENTLRMPPIILSFYGLFFENQTVPEEKELIDHYLKQAFFQKLSDSEYVVIQEGQKFTISKNALEARILRTYPSLIRDLHFYCLINESGRFQNVMYSCKEDYYNKIDMKVRLGNKWFNLGMLLDSSRSEFFRQKKQTRHEMTEEVIYIKLSRNNSIRCGKFWLFTKEHVNVVYDEIKKRV